MPPSVGVTAGLLLAFPNFLPSGLCPATKLLNDRSDGTAPTSMAFVYRLPRLLRRPPRLASSEVAGVDQGERVSQEGRRHRLVVDQLLHGQALPQGHEGGGEVLGIILERRRAEVLHPG